jgi:hypothetical protein
MSFDSAHAAPGAVTVAAGRHFPSGRFTDVTGGQGGPARHQCGGCGDPIVSSYDKWLSVFSGQRACRGYWREESEVAAS